MLWALADYEIDLYLSILRALNSKKVEGFYHYGFRADSGNQQKLSWILTDKIKQGK